MTENIKTKVYDLEERTLEFAKAVISFCKKLSKNSINFPLINQVVRSSGSVGANYIEANEALSKKDFHHRIKICLKEAKESKYWLLLITDSNDEFTKETKPLIDESIELVKIFSSINSKK
ncbi:MAG: four helix bundle protein [bacterium]|nr:four helix bundle protein [bacterium]